MKRLLSSALLLTTLITSLVVNAGAADYSFKTDTRPEYYASTSYEDVYGSQYNYSGPNVVDYLPPELPYGNFSTTQAGVMEKHPSPGLLQNIVISGGDYGIGNGSSVLFPGISEGTDGNLLPVLPSFTQLTDDFYLSNGAVGYLSIPKVNISRFYIWEGETASSMKKGVAHFSSTSVWSGNVGICGHNRGAKYSIGNIKNLDHGDEIIYTTSQGTRTYRVETVTKISSDDWSYLNPSYDNRITLITCVANDPSHRWCVVAIAVD